jgi:hypothetical protein
MKKLGTISLLLDEGDDCLKAEDSMIRNEETKHKMTQDSPMSLQLPNLKAQRFGNMNKQDPIQDHSNDRQEGSTYER